MKVIVLSEKRCQKVKYNGIRVLLYYSISLFVNTYILTDKVKRVKGRTGKILHQNSYFAVLRQREQTGKRIFYPSGQFIMPKIQIIRIFGRIYR